jgi:ribosome-associated toxin RatA of RatAB toxin-antitoxin module
MRAAAAVAILLLACQICSAQVVSVKVQRHGETIVMDVEATVEAPVREAWAVFTDYDHMSSFISNLKQSKVLVRDDNQLVVEQAGETKVAFLRFGFKAVRAVELIPMQEIRSSLVSGDFKAYLSTTRIAATPTGAKISHHGEYVPKSWMPPLIGPAVIESETRKQYQEFIAEIQRRATAVKGP